MATKRKLTDFTPDSRNANKGTVRGLAMLEDSLRKYGAGRSVLVDRNGKIIAGNKTVESAVDVGLTDAIVVPTDGKQLVVVQRVDVDLDTPAGRELAIADNRTGEVSLAWDADVLQALAGEGVELNQFFDDDELAAILAAVDAPEPWRAEEQDDFYSDPDGDGIATQAGYRLSSIWYGMTAHNDVREHMLELPPREKVHKNDIQVKYSRTNPEETERIVKTYMRPGDRFFEMCCGWMTFSSTAKYYGFSGRGGDIWDVSLKFCQRQLEAMPGAGNVDVITADCRDTKEPPNTYDFVHSNPPFFSLEPYGESDADLASMGSYERWLDAMAQMGNEAARILKPGGLANFVINDYRQDGVLIPMHADYMAAIGRTSGLVLHDFVVAEVISQALRFRKHDYERRRTVKCHEYVITFRKPGGA